MTVLAAHGTPPDGNFLHPPAVSKGGSNELGECLLWGEVVEGGAGAVARFVGDGVEVGLVMASLWADSGARDGSCFRSCPSPKGCGGG